MERVEKSGFLVVKIGKNRAEIIKTQTE